MANQTLTTGTPTERINYDSTTLEGLANGETITINGGHLLINGDTRWGYNAAVVDNMAISSTLGGSILFDGTTVWEVPYTSATGVVPPRNAVGSNGVTGSGVTGELQAVWANGSLTPTNAGGTMPASGWIKLRDKTGTISNGQVLTLSNGATVTASGAGKRSWIHIVGEGLGSVGVPRLGRLTITGDWYDLGTTNGSDDQTFQFPVADNCPAIQIETSAGSGEYEWWLNSASRWGASPQFVATDERGKYFGCDNTTGVLTIAKRATNACGFKPPSGCKVRVPNVILSTSTSANWNVNTIAVTQGDRYDFTTSQAGAVYLDKMVCNWNLSLTNSFQIKVSDSAVLQAITITNTADTIILDSIGVGLNSNQETNVVSISNCFTSVYMNKVRAVRYASTGTNQSAIICTDVANFTAIDCQMEMFGALTTVARGNSAANPFYLNRVVGTNLLLRPTIMGGRLQASTCANISVIDARFADLLNGETSTANAVHGLDFGTGCVNVKIEGFSSFANLPNIHPYNGMVNVGSGTSGFDVRNIGTIDAPYNCGTVNPCDRIVGASAAVDIQLRRLYAINTRSAPLNIGNTSQNVVIDNVHGDYNDIQSLLGANLVARGCKWAYNTTGQSSVYGRHWEDSFISATEGEVVIACNEPLPVTAAQVSLSVGDGSGFTSSGNIAMGKIGDTATWVMPYFAIGHTGFGQTGTLSPLEMRGTNVYKQAYDYQVDRGNGYSDWKRLTTPMRRNLFGTAGTNYFDADALGVLPNIGDKVQSISGSLPFGTTITNIVGYRVTVSNNFTVNLASGEIVYAWSEIEDEPAIDPNTGFRMKIRATCVTADPTNTITYICVRTKTDATSQRLQYPLPRTQLTVTGFVAGSDVVIYNADVEATGDGSNVLATGDAVSGSFVFDYESTPNIKIGVFKGGYVPQVTPVIALTASNSGYTIQQRIDRNYF